MGINAITICVITALVDNDDILLIYRKKEPYKGYWALPGGKIEHGEHPEHAAEREIFEEAGIKARCIGVYGINSEIFSSETTNHFITFFCLLKAESRDYKSGEEGELKWFSLNNLPKNIVPNDPLMLEEFIKKGSPIKIFKTHICQQGADLLLKRFDHE